jgi:hypothetical protein
VRTGGAAPWPAASAPLPLDCNIFPSALWDFVSVQACKCPSNGHFCHFS